jgi:hypothetical protein
MNTEQRDRRKLEILWRDYYQRKTDKTGLILVAGFILGFMAGAWLLHGCGK